MGLIKETLKEAFEDTKQEFGFTKPDWIVSNLQKIGLMIWWAVFAIWLGGVQIYLPIKMFMYGKMNNSLTYSFGAVFVMLISSFPSANSPSSVHETGSVLSTVKALALKNSKQNILQLQTK